MLLALLRAENLETERQPPRPGGISSQVHSLVVDI